MMVGVGRLVPSSTTYMHHQAVLTEYLDERITPRHAACILEQRADNDIKLYATKARIVFPVVLSLFYNERLYRIFCEVVFLVLVE